MSMTAASTAVTTFIAMTSHKPRASLSLPRHCYAYGLLLTYGLITILAVYETARAYPGISTYVYFTFLIRLERL